VCVCSRFVGYTLFSLFYVKEVFCEKVWWNLKTTRAPRSAWSIAGGNPAWEGLASHPVSSLGTEVVTPGLSVGKKGSRPKAKVEDVESRNFSWEWSMHGSSRRQHWA